MRNTVIFAAMLLLSACQPMPGGDRDKHGCLGSGGYQWCPASDSCERPWELAQEKGFERSQAAFDEYCSS
ncbi:MAG: serine protease [Alcanivorax sp.]|uniref:serine protease n=1 Tax=Alcanivorax sp. TaxID=1872427 RepID=UPI003DA79FCE